MSDSLDDLPETSSRNGERELKLFDSHFPASQSAGSSSSAPGWKTQLKNVGIAALVFFIFSLPLLDPFIKMIPGCSNGLVCLGIKTLLFAVTIFLLGRYL